MSQLAQFKENVVDGYQPRVMAELSDGTLEIHFTDDATEHLQKQIEDLAKNRYGFTVNKDVDNKGSHVCWKVFEY